MSMTPTTEEAKTKGQSLDLRDLHAANIARQAEWCPDQVPDLSFRGNELGGECGEAQNVIKKLERERQGWRGSRATKDDLADELADVVICADLCAVTAGIDLGGAVLRKFNATSEKQGLSVFLPSAPALAAPRADSAERAAGEVPWPEQYAALADGYGPVEEWRDWTKQAGREPLSEGALHALRGMVGEFATPAPSSPGVPDSVREAFLAADLHECWVNGDTADVMTSPFPGCGNFNQIVARCATGDLWRKRAVAIAEALNFVRTLSSAHPAGQSTGQGAEAMREAAAAICDERQELCSKNAVNCDEDGERQWSLAATCLRGAARAIRGLPAPDSTRTGQVEAEAEALRKAVSKALHDNQFLDGWPDLVDPVVDAVLAARPAAPEAQGAWIVTNGEAGDNLRFRMWSGRAWIWTHSLAHAAHFARKRDANQILSDGEDHGERIVPAPPASSGQES